ncbi:MAG: hypothetical protein RIB60_10285 [Phycisphaerales bacterium]
MPESEPNTAPTALVWCRPEQTGLVRDIADRAGLTIETAGSPEPTRAGHVATELGAEPADDLRAALAATGARVALLADPGAFSEGANDEDAGAVAAARSRGTTLITLEPIPPAAADLPGSPWVEQQPGGRPIDAVRLGTLPRRTRAWIAASDLLDAFGTVRSMSVEVMMPTHAGTLGAALVGALDLVSAVLGDAESVDAALMSDTRARDAAPESVRGFTGSVSALVRGADGRCASLHASDQSGAFAFGTTLVGEAGTLRITHAGFSWTDARGALVDDHADLGGTPGSPADAAARVIAERIVRLTDPSEPEPAPDGLPETLAFAHAALLSARTGQPESPATIRRLVSAR